jgi:hypothetical protein
MEYQTGLQIAADYRVDRWQGLKLTDPTDFNVPLQLKAGVVSPEQRFPGFAGDWQVVFSAPQRNREMILNDSQKLRLEQQVLLTFTATKAPEKIADNYARKVPGHRWSIQYLKKSPTVWERIARYEMDQPKISSEAYAQVRQEMMSWIERLQADDF